MRMQASLWGGIGIVRLSGFEALSKVILVLDNLKFYFRKVKTEN